MAIAALPMRSSNNSPRKMDAPVSHPRLDTLPTELLVQIFSYLAPIPSLRPKATSNIIERAENDSQQYSLRNVKAVCRSFAAIVTPLLQACYHDCDFYCLARNRTNFEAWEKVRTVIQDDSNCQDPRGDTFHHYLNLAEIKEKLGLNEVWHDPEIHANIFERDNYDGSDGLYDGLSEDVFDNISPFDPEGFRRRMKVEGIEDDRQTNFERAAVLCLCPNVEEILYGSHHDSYWRGDSVDEDYTAIRPLVFAGRGIPFGRTHAFSHLRYLSIDVQNIRIERIVPVMRIPSLRHFVVEWRNWSTTGYSSLDLFQDALHLWGCPAGASNIEILEMRKVECPGALVGKMIKSCKALKKFDMDCLPWEQSKAWYSNIFDELKAHSSTLESLIIQSCAAQEYADKGPIIKESELQQYKMLKRLRIQLRTITGYGGFRSDTTLEHAMPDLYTMFPRSIESIELDIHGPTPYEETTHVLSDLMTHPDKPPLLKRVHVHVHVCHEVSPYLPLDLYSLSNICDHKSEVRFDYTLAHFWIEWTDEIEEARRRILGWPHGEVLIKHATLGMEKRWNELLSRDVNMSSPFRDLRVHEDDAREKGWLRDDVGPEHVEKGVLEAEKLGHFEKFITKDS
ncbi:unnamed protein product [Periconia digitata]|uniref:F-box domain-containing protein n=1 Tax=Periconia digitata TaxID=1303443 RepID=A0A9W4UPF1_9PLEO|nr:unnamed protein product [Periconia digitata]